MNKMYLTFFIIVFIMLFWGCSPSPRKIDDKVKKLSAEIQTNNRQIKSDISAIKKDLHDLKSEMNEETQKIYAEIQNNNNQFKTENQTIKEDLDDFESNMGDEIQKLNSDVQKNSSKLKNEIPAIRKELASLESDLNRRVQELDDDIKKNNNNLNNENQTIKEDLDDFKSNIGEEVKRLNTDVQENLIQVNEIPSIKKDFISLESNLNGQFHKFNTGFRETVSRQKIYWTSSILVVFLIIGGIYFFIRYRIKRLNYMLKTELSSSIEDLKNDTIQLDTKLVQALDQKLGSDNLLSRPEAEPDHSLPIKVCEEIQRMRNRLKHMDQDDQATKVFSRRLESLEGKLNEMEYEIVNLENKPYNEGLTVKANFIPNEDMKSGEEIITRVIKPQINYKNELIQAAEVEVSQGV